MLQSQITARIDAFVTELHALVQREALEAVSRALGTAPSRPAPSARPATVRGPGRPRRPVAKPSAVSKPSAPVAAAAPASKLSSKRKKGAKRSPAELAKIDAAIRGYVKANAGKGVEAMAKSLGVPSKDLKGRISLLIDAKKLKKTGQKRATKYFSA